MLTDLSGAHVTLIACQAVSTKYAQNVLKISSTLEYFLGIITIKLFIKRIKSQTSLILSGFHSGVGNNKMDHFFSFCIFFELLKLDMIIRNS